MEGTSRTTGDADGGYHWLVCPSPSSGTYCVFNGKVPTWTVLVGGLNARRSPFAFASRPVSSTAVQTLHSSTRLFIVSLSSHPHLYLYASFVGRLTVHHFLCIARQSEKYPALNRSTIVTQYGLTGPLKSRPIRFASGERVPNFRTPVGRLVSQSNKQAISRPAESSQRFPRNTRATKPSSSRSFLKHSWYLSYDCLWCCLWDQHKPFRGAVLVSISRISSAAVRRVSILGHLGWAWPVRRQAQIGLKLIGSALSHACHGKSTNIAGEPASATFERHGQARTEEQQPDEHEQQGWWWKQSLGRRWTHCSQSRYVPSAAPSPCIVCPAQP